MAGNVQAAHGHVGPHFDPRDAGEGKAGEEVGEHLHQQVAAADHVLHDAQAGAGRGVRLQCDRGGRLARVHHRQPGPVDDAARIVREQELEPRPGVLREGELGDALLDGVAKGQLEDHVGFGAGDRAAASFRQWNAEALSGGHFVDLRRRGGPVGEQRQFDRGVDEAGVVHDQAGLPAVGGRDIRDGHGPGRHGGPDAEQQEDPADRPLHRNPLHSC